MHDLDWNAIRDFLAVARGGSLSAAGIELGVNASTVGRRIEALEKHLGLRLFSRARSGYLLTDDGRALIERAERFEEAAWSFARGADAKHGLLHGRVRLATAENLANFLLIPEMPSLHRDHPNLTTEIVTDIRSANLHRRDADLALRLVRPVSGNVSVRRLATQRYGLYGSIAYLEKREPRAAGRFEEDRFIAWSERYADLSPARWVDETLEGRTPTLVLSSLYAQYVAARAGLGLAVLPCFLADGDADLRRLRCEVDAIEQDLWLVIHTDLAGSARVRAVADFVVDIVLRNRDRLAGTGSRYAER